MDKKPRHPYLQSDRPWVMAHRGDSVRAPANTMVAFAMAVDAGADVLEIDVHWTKDDAVVVSHDATVDAMSDGHGAIADMSLAQLKELDFGYRFSDDGGKTFPYRGKRVAIPTLREVLRTFPDVRVNMDIKPRRLGSLATLMSDIDESRALARVLVASFHHETLRVVRRMNLSVATSASPREVAAFVLGVKLRAHVVGRSPYVALQVPASVGTMAVVTPAFVRAAHQRGVAVHVWTVDDATTMESLFDLGVDAIVSNDAQLAVVVRNRFLAVEQTIEPLNYGEG